MRAIVNRNMVKSILVTAGPTREKIDPVRFISNYSTGTFGYELAREAGQRGCKVTLVSGPSGLTPPRGVKFISVETAEEMSRAIRKNPADCLIMAAAVCDWKAAKVSAKKLKKEGAIKTLRLKRNPDILKELGRRKRGLAVGFALETENLEKNAIKKLKDKNLDIIIANRLGKKKPLFGLNNIDIIIIDRRGIKERYKNSSKKTLSKIILDKVLNYNI